MKVGPHRKQRADPAPLEKITALESELLKLRAQIAMIITAAPGSGCNDCASTSSHTHTHAITNVPMHLKHGFNQWLYTFNFPSGLVESQNTPSTPGTSPPPPGYTSTPRCIAAAPPPPPPPPLCYSSSNETCSVLELIHQRKKVKDSTLKREDVKGIPSMLDVLKDLNQVKLRSVERYTLKSTVLECLHLVLSFKRVFVFPALWFQITRGHPSQEQMQWGRLSIPWWPSCSHCWSIKEKIRPESP